jgi:hypothetical protein
MTVSAVETGQHSKWSSGRNQSVLQICTYSRLEAGQPPTDAIASVQARVAQPQIRPKFTSFNFPISNCFVRSAVSS